MCKGQACRFENDVTTCCTAVCNSISNAEAFCSPGSGSLITNADTIRCKGPVCRPEVDAERCCKPRCGDFVNNEMCAAVNRVYSATNEG